MLHVWNMYLHLPQTWPSYVGRYSIHGAFGIHFTDLLQFYNTEFICVEYVCLGPEDRFQPFLPLGTAPIKMANPGETHFESVQFFVRICFGVAIVAISQSLKA